MKLGKEIKETPEKRQCTKTKEKVSTHFGKRVKEDLKGEPKKRRRRDKTGSRLAGVDTGSLVHALAQPSPARPPSPPPARRDTAKHLYGVTC